jgi:hypothetical protein
MASEKIFRHVVALSFGVILAIFALFFTLLLFWSAIGIKAILRQRHGGDIALKAGREWCSEELPEEFRFISRDTTVQQLVERVGPYTRIRGDSDTGALEYDLPYGSALLIFPEWPCELGSRVRGVQFYRKRDEIHLFP